MKNFEDGFSITYQEIIRQQSGWKKALEDLKKEKIKHLEILNQFKDKVWVFTGCGTSFYLAQTASNLFEMLTGIPTKAVPSSEILIYPKLVLNPVTQYLLVPISRSGTSTEVVKAAQKVKKEFSIPILAVSCDANSQLIKNSDFNLTFPFEKEQSVVMTGSFTTMLLSIIHLASLLVDDEELVNKLKNLADESHRIMKKFESRIMEIANDNNLNHFVFLGQGPFLGLANEAALKIQEMSISLSQSYHTLEFRHGPKSTASDNTLITILLSESGKAYEAHLADDMKTLGTKTFILQGENYSNLCDKSHYLINVPANYGDIFNSFMYLPLLQLLGYYKALSKNINPDNPKNLSAVVTFETKYDGDHENQ